jgi:pimeloyl-ACP methyl ester carboxylesterase
VHLVGYSYGTANAVIFLDKLKRLKDQEKKNGLNSHEDWKVRTITLLDLNPPTVTGTGTWGKGERLDEYWRTGFLQSGRLPITERHVAHNMLDVFNERAGDLKHRRGLMKNWTISVPELNNNLVEYSLNIRSNKASWDFESWLAYHTDNHFVVYERGLKVANATYKLAPQKGVTIEHLDLPDSSDARKAIVEFIKNPKVAPPSGNSFTKE